MAVTKKSALIAAIVASLGVGAMVVGGIFLKQKLDGTYGVSVEDESQKILLIGAWKEIEGSEPILQVGIMPPDAEAVYKTLKISDMKYNSSGQTDIESVWYDASDWFKSIAGDVRIDRWCEDGGRLCFQSSCKGLTSIRKIVDFGGGSYFVEAPEEGKEQRVIHNTVRAYVPEVDIE